MRYPNGKIYSKDKLNLDTSIKEKKHYNLKDNASNRGMGLEEDISNSCEYYNNLNVCLIYKRPTPIKVVKMDKINRSKITEAYFSSKSTTDYNGVYKGKYMDFEAKETINKTSFSFHNIRSQQIEHLSEVTKLGGLAFFIIRMKAYNETYLLKYSDIEPFLVSKLRASLPYSYIKENGFLIEESYLPRLKFLQAVDKAFFGM